MLYRRGDFALEPDGEFVLLFQQAATDWLEFEQNHNSVTQQLAEIHKTYSSNSTIGLVLAATQSEDLTWLLEYCRDQYVPHLLSIQYTD